ncbi:MAG: RluA family pseudouridine synthase [Oscillospiraceae bacterium]|nr:RluA family pseudouridine synthase [Oscillospiraceae bacterium]
MTEKASELLRFEALPEDEGERLDSFTAERASGLSRTAAARLVEEGAVLLNSAAALKNSRLKAGDIVELKLPEPVSCKAEPQNIELDVVYEDGELIVVNKPKGMVVHPAAGNPDGTLVNALLYHCAGRLSGINGVLRPGIVHRIDKDTSGLLVVAKTDEAHRCLAGQIAEHSVTRLYEAIAHGGFKSENGTVNAPIGRDKRDRKKFCVCESNSKPAVTHYELLADYGAYSRLRLRLETGRTHQIRVHMAYIGHPLAGDRVYGPKNTPKELCGQCLHAGTLGFIHPSSGRYIEFTREPPGWFLDFEAGLKGKVRADG